MPTYISLLEFTDDGIANIEDSPDRLEAAKRLAEEMECEVTAFYLTFGRFDAVTILDAPGRRSSSSRWRRRARSAARR